MQLNNSSSSASADPTRFVLVSQHHGPETIRAVARPDSARRNLPFEAILSICAHKDQPDCPLTPADLKPPDPKSTVDDLLDLPLADMSGD